MIQHTSNVKLIKETIKDFYSNIAYDDSPPLSEFNPTGAWFILKEGDQTAGIINLVQLTNVAWVPHIYIKPEYRGKDSIKWGKEVLEFMGEEAKYLIMTPYKSAKRYAEKLGFKYITTMNKSIKKNGKLLDQYILEGN